MAKKKLSYWNYRIMKSESRSVDGTEEYTNYSIIEVYYDSKDQIMGYSDHQFPYGETEKELKSDLSMMLKACRLPALTFEQLNPSKKKVKKIKIPVVKSKNINGGKNG